MLTYGVYIITSRSGDKANGQISNCVFQVTSEPVRIAAVIHKDNLTHKYISECAAFAVCVLDQSTPMELIGRFGFTSGRNTDKLCDMTCSAGVTGCPLVSDHVLAQLEAEVCAQLDVGTHTIFVGDVVSGVVIQEGTPLTYAYYQENLKGKSPKRAPTYIPD
jgi:ferric-chelate reductase [NAD(P)H]